MSGRQPVLALLLAFAVVAAGAVCACALPTNDGAHHSHHHHGESASSDAHCAHADCQGDCGIDALVPEPVAAVDPPKTSLEDAAALAAMLPAVPSARLRHCHSPPSYCAPPVDSPVRRFDKLLN